MLSTPRHSLSELRVGDSASPEWSCLECKNSNLNFALVKNCLLSRSCLFIVATFKGKMAYSTWPGLLFS
jgi:hypothetical protein